MKLLYHTPAFWPSMGGVEVIAETMALELQRAGIDFILVTETPDGGQSRDFPYPVLRHPSPMERLRLAQWADVVYSSMASLAMWPYAMLANRPFLWTHNAYQAACLDGLGWVNGAPSPLSPRSSFWYHWQSSGPVATLSMGAKLLLRRSVARHGVVLNLPSTRWMQSRLGLPRCLQAYTPFPLRTLPEERQEKPDFTYLYVGRLVSEKGVEVLLEAFRRVVLAKGHEQERLLIVGDGPVRGDLERWVAERGLGGSVSFTGTLRGDALRAAMWRAEIAVVPSNWEEPMGGVTLELLAARRALIVSRRGGHAEVAGEAALTFENGDAEALAEQMLALSEDAALRTRLRAAAPERLAAFAEDRLTARYITVFQAVDDFWKG